MNSFEKKKNYFELGIAFARFSAKPDEDEHEIICKVASRLELKIPDYNELLIELVTGGGVVGPPQEWFEGTDGESRRNYGRIGTLSFAIFLLAQGKKDISDAAVQELMTLFQVEDIPTDILNDYLDALKTGDAAAAFRGFLAAFSKSLSSGSGSNEQIFDNVDPAPLIFDDKILQALQITINQASVCYREECYLATVVLCGKIIETLLAHAYEWLTGENPVEKQLAFNRVCNRLRQNHNVLLDDAVDNQLRLIYARRSAAIHGNTQVPTEDEAKGVAILTQNVINIIYSYFNDLEDFIGSWSEWCLTACPFIKKNPYQVCLLIV